MNKQAAVAGSIAILLVAAVVGSILFSTRHNKVELKGNVTPRSYARHRRRQHSRPRRHPNHQSIDAAVRS